MISIEENEKLISAVRINRDGWWPTPSQNFKDEMWKQKCRVVRDARPARLKSQCYTRWRTPTWRDGKISMPAEILVWHELSSFWRDCLCHTLVVSFIGHNRTSYTATICYVDNKTRQLLFWFTCNGYDFGTWMTTTGMNNALDDVHDKTRVKM